MKKSFFCRGIFALLIAFSAAVYAENFRVRKVIPIKISEEGSVKAVSGISDALFITLPDDMTFINGIELSFKIPEEIAVWRDSVAYVFYENVSPSPSENEADYSGDKLFLKTIPPKLSLVLDIPLASDFSIKENPYSLRISQISNYEKGIFIRFQQVMKGVPESLENAEIEISAKPVFRNKGILNLKINPPQTEEKKYSVYIDENPAQNYEKIMLETGEHHLAVSGDSYRNELRTFRIEQGKTTSLEIALRGNEPVFKIVSPDSAAILLDGNPLKNKKDSFAVEPGEHVIKFTIGDYETVRNVTAVKGHSYVISLDVSASVTEEE